MSDIERTIEELKKAGFAADKIDRGRAEKLGMLLKNPGWDIYAELLRARIQGCADEIMRPGGTVDGLVALEYIKGTMAGLLLAVGIPAAIIEAMKELRPGPATDDGDDA